jgi:hypothetical protein
MFLNIPLMVWGFTDLCLCSKECLMANQRAKALSKLREQVQATNQITGNEILTRAFNDGRLSVNEYRKLKKFNLTFVRKPRSNTVTTVLGQVINLDASKSLPVRDAMLSSRERQDLKNELRSNVNLDDLREQLREEGEL